MLGCRTLDKTIASLETELSAARSLQESLLNGSPVAEEFKVSESIGRRKYLMVIGINTAFSSRKRRDSIRYTWMPQGSNIKNILIHHTCHLFGIFLVTMLWITNNIVLQIR